VFDEKSLVINERSGRIGEIFYRRIYMKHYRIFLAITVLVLASLACNALVGGGEDGSTTPSESSSGDQAALPTATAIPSNDSGGSDSVTVKTDFPMTDDAFNFIDVGDGSILYYTKMSSDDVLKFYRDEYTSRGYKERELLTSISDGVFSIVFDGDPSGKAVVIQSVDLGDGSRTIAIRLEDV